MLSQCEERFHLVLLPFLELTPKVEPPLALKRNQRKWRSEERRGVAQSSAASAAQLLLFTVTPGGTWSNAAAEHSG